MAERLKPSHNLQLREKIIAEPYWFAREALGNQMVFPEQPTGDWKQLFDFVFALGHGMRRGVVTSPRLTYKTTLLACLVVWLICLDPNIRILYITNVYKNAATFSKCIQSWLETNEVIRTAYGNLRPDGTSAHSAWRDDYLFVSTRTTSAREPTFAVATTGQTIVGLHEDIILVDDAVDLDNSQTAGGLQKTINWFRLLSKILDEKSKYGPGGCMLDQGTRYADGDLHGWLLGETDDEDCPAELYEKLVLRSMKNPECWNKQTKQFVNPDLNFPTILPEAKLREERLAGSYWFYTQYQNECVSPDQAIFTRQQFKMIPDYDLPLNLRTFVLADYAHGLETTNDRTAIWVVGLDYDRTAYGLELDVGRWSLSERARRTVEYAEKYKAEAIATESVIANEGIANALGRLIRERHLRIRLIPISGRSSEKKKLRIISLQPRFENGRIFFVQRRGHIGLSPEMMRVGHDRRVYGEAVEEFIRYPRAPHDDIPDALSDLDKLDPHTKNYLFAGAPAGLPVRQPELVNNRPTGQPELRTGGGFWQEAAARFRQRGSFYGGRHG